MSDWKSLFPFVGERTVARRLDDMTDRKTVIGALLGAAVGGFVTTAIAFFTPTQGVALLVWALVLLAIPLLSVYWKSLQNAWDEATDED